MLVKELNDPHALLRPEVQEIMRAAIESGVLLAPYGFDTLAPELADFIMSPEHFVILGTEKGRFEAMAMGFFNTSRLFPYPTIVLFYNRGSAALRKALAAKILDIIASRGYTGALALNGSGRSDEAWIKALTPENVSGRKVGSLVMLQVE